MDHAALRELAAGAALEDLEPLERLALDQHLAACRDCRALAAELDQLMADLALVSEDREPPASLHGDVLAAIRSSGDRSSSTTVSLAGTAVPAPVPLRPAGSPLAARLPALAVLAVAADPSHRTAGLHAPTGPSATVVWVPGTEDAFLVSHNLPATPSGRVYQLWHADESGVHPLATFTHDGEGPLIAPFGVDLATSSAAMVTLEPVGGAQAEPGAEVVFGEL